MGVTNGTGEGVAPVELKAHRARWLALAGVGAALVVAGTFMPFAHLTLRDGFAFTRTDWQMGANSSVQFGTAPLLLIDVTVVLLGFFAVEGVLGAARTVRRRTSLVAQFFVLFLTAIELKSTFPGTWTGVTVARGLGGWICYLGVVVLFGVYMVEVQRYAFPGPTNEAPLNDRERQVLARADQRRVRRAIAPFVGGAVFALVMKFSTGWSWPRASAMFVATTPFYWWQSARSLTNLRRRSEFQGTSQE